MARLSRTRLAVLEELLSSAGDGIAAVLVALDRRRRAEARGATAEELARLDEEITRAGERLPALSASERHELRVLAKRAAGEE